MIDTKRPTKPQKRSKGRQGKRVKVADAGKRGAVGPPKKKPRWALAKTPHISISHTVESFIALLAAPRLESGVYDVASWIREVSETLRNAEVFQDESLGSLVGRCRELNNLGMRVGFLSMLAQIQLVAKCKRCVVL